MKNLFLLAFLAMMVHAKAQFVFEHDHDSSATWNVPSSRGSQLMIVKFEVSGERYVKLNRAGKVIKIYDLNHSLIKTISLANLPVGTNPYLGDVLYISENLFNTDSQMEFMYIYPITINTTGNYVTNVYNENGNILFTDTAWPAIRPNFAQQQLPIYNTSNGTKMILSKQNGHAKVYGLGGTLSTAIKNANQTLIEASDFISSAYPNPSSQSTTIEYKLPDNCSQGEIIFYDLHGKEVKRIKVDQTFKSTLVSTTDIPSGTYFYQLQADGKASEGKKLVVIK